MESSENHLSKTTSLDPYDQLPYNAKAIPQAHPSKLAAVARLFGIQACEPATCRLLDIGCADGAHLLPLAIEFPNATFVGVDLSAEHIFRGQRAVAELGLKNITLLCADFSQHDFGAQGFDYVIAHGFYSWVPLETRFFLLRSMRKWLGATGIGYLSYNTLPGAFLKSAARQIGRDLVEKSDQATSNVDQFRALAKQLSSALSSPHPLCGALKKEFATVAAATDSLIAHDWFESVCDPVSFLTLAEQLNAEGLQFLAEAELKNSPMPHLSPAERRMLAEYGTSRNRREACLDVLTCNGFRQSLVVGAEAVLPSQEDRAAIQTLYLTSDASCEGAKNFRDGEPLEFINSSGMRIQIGNFWAKSALCALMDSYPQALGFEQLTEMVGRSVPNAEQVKQGSAVLQDALFELSLLGFVELRVHAPRCSRTMSSHPVINPIARWQAKQIGAITNQHHVPVTIEDPSIRVLISLLDGTRDHAAALEAWRQGCAALGLSMPTEPDLERVLARLQRFALFIA